MSRRLPLIVALATLFGFAGFTVPLAANAAAPTFSHLDPGGQPSLTETVPVNVVFVGYHPSAVDAPKFKNKLPKSYEPLVRSRFWYGIQEPLGIHYNYDYKVRFAGQDYEDTFFAKLGSLAQPAPLTFFQHLYNKETNNVLQVRNNHYIDAPSVEKWLALNPPAGIDTTRNTVYLINWYGRPDFKFHVYTKTDEPDPDTGYNFGVNRQSRKIIAWGGTTADDEESGLGSTHRVWFHDTSAGPERIGGSWNVDRADLDGDGVPDYRIPPIWEYTPGGYRSPSALTGDLVKLVRYVALDLLMTTSPIYPVELPTAEPPQTINLDSNTYEGWPGVDASAEYIKQPLVVSELAELLWRKTLSYDNQDFRYAGEAKRCYRLFVQDVPCYPELDYPAFANLYLQNTFQLARTKDDGDSVDYELPIFNYSLPPGTPAPFLGFADDNYRDGTQSYVFNLLSDEIVAAGYGLTTTIIHEVGHHVGLSHPHDGYDSTSGVDFGPTGDFYFAWAGDESNTMMSYIDLNWDFSQFDQDNMNRFQAATYIEAANRLAADALGAPDASASYDELQAADDKVGAAEAAFAAHDYRAAWTKAQQAYELVVQGAEDAGVDVETVLAARAASAASSQAAAAHSPGEFIDSLEPTGPRAQP
jgi:hypothetical protein